MDQQRESECQELRRFLEGELGAFKSQFCELSETVWLDPSFLPKFAVIEQARKAAKVWEERTTRVDWDRLPEWIDAAVQSFRCQWDRDTALMKFLGVSMSKVDLSSLEAMQAPMHQSPIVQGLQRTFGPNWVSFAEEFSRESIGGDVSLYCNAVLDRVEEVISNWKKLQALNEARSLDCFEKEWAQWTTLERSSWLQRQYPDLPHSPHADIYAWSWSSEPERKKLDSKLFLTPLLNVEDLSRDMVLPNLLNARATSHPSLFRASDGHSVYLGFFGGPLKLAVKGSVLFNGQGEVESYGISFQDGHDSNNLLSLHAIPAKVAVFQLEAQRQIYNFLVSCPSKFLGSSRSGVGVEETFNQTCSTEYPSILTQSSRLDYSGHSGTVDLKYLDSLVRPSLDEALDDLSQLRCDYEVWISRLNETSTKPPGRVPNLLRPVFHRIDIFQALSDAICACEAQHGGSTSPAQPDLKYLYAAFQSSLNEELYRFQDIEWSPCKSASFTFTQLFNMMRENDVTVWVMGLLQVMRVLDLEIRKDKAEETVPFAVIRTLNDISVLAVGVQEIWKHYYSVSHAIDFDHLVNEAEARWKERQRPWQLVIENTIQALLKSEMHKLDTHIRRQDISRRKQLHDFWAVIDKHMKISSQSSETIEVVEMIQQTAPIDTTSPAENVLTDTWMRKDMEAPSGTQLHRSRHRKSRPANDLSLRNSLAKRPTPQTPVRIEPTTDRDFWAALLADSSQNSTELDWKDFCKAMGGIGYKVIPQTGSVYRFEYSERRSNRNLGTIIFHAPHGGGSKVTHRQARSWWLRRLSSRFQVIL